MRCDVTCIRDVIVTDRISIPDCVCVAAAILFFMFYLFIFFLFILSITVSVYTNFITLRAKLSGAMYLLWVLSVCNGRAGGRAGGVCGWVCYRDNSKLRALILTKLGL